MPDDPTAEVTDLVQHLIGKRDHERVASESLRLPTGRRASLAEDFPA